MRSIPVESIVALIQRAGEEILSVYRRPFQSRYKTDRTLFTEADELSQRLILEGLSEIAAGIPVLSEEGKAISYTDRKEWDRYFLIDPLDGTEEFVKRSGEFAVNIALVHHRRPVFGVIHLPLEGVTYLAETGSGAYRLVKEKEKLPFRNTRDETVRIVLSRNDFSPALLSVISELPSCTVDRLGSSRKFCLVAEGSADVYLRMRGAMEWDTAAGVILVEEAGGRVRSLSDESILYNRPSLHSPPFAVFGRAFLEKTETPIQNFTHALDKISSAKGRYPD